MKKSSKNKVAAKTLSGKPVKTSTSPKKWKESKTKEKAKKRKKTKTSRGREFYPLIYVDLEIAYSEGNKPYIGQICIIDDKAREILNYYYEDPRDITSEAINEILKHLYANYIVCCDPTLDVKVIKHDARRCGIKLRTSKLRFIDVQIIEQIITKPKEKKRIALQKLAAKYDIRPPVKFHDPFSDASVIKNVFESQLKVLDIDKEQLHALEVV